MHWGNQNVVISSQHFQYNGRYWLWYFEVEIFDEWGSMS